MSFVDRLREFFGPAADAVVAGAASPPEAPAAEAPVAPAADAPTAPASRSVEDPRQPLTSLALLAALGGAHAYTGKHVNPQTAMQNATVFACVRVISETIATLPLIMYRRLSRGKERAPDHPLWRVLHDEPNPEMSSVEFWEALVAHVLLWGNAYAEVQLDGGGRVRRLWPLRPDRTKPIRLQSGELAYEVTLATGERRTLRADQVLHIRGLGFDGRLGYSVIALARETIGLSMAAEEYAGRFYANDSSPAAVLQHPGNLSPKAQDNLAISWEAKHGGLENKHRLAILEEGMTYKATGIPPKDAQFIESRQFQANEILKWFRVQPHKVGELDRATWGNIEHLAIEHVTDTLRPWTVRIEKAINRALLTRQEQDTYFAEFLLDGLLRGDSATRYQAYSIGFGKWLSANEIRERENMNPMEGGDELAMAAGDGGAPEEQPLTLGDRAEAVGALVRAGYKQADAARVVGLPPMEDWCAPPVTVQSPAALEEPAQPAPAPPAEEDQDVEE